MKDLNTVSNQSVSGVQIVQMSEFVSAFKNNGEKKKEDVLYVDRQRIGSVKIYDVLESELDKLGIGNETSIYFNVCTSSISIFVSFFIALLTTRIEGKCFTVFVVITAVSFATAVVTLFIWLAKRKDVKNIIQEIKERGKKV